MKINLLVDYNNHFGLKHNAIPYRSGMDKELIIKYFAKKNYEVELVNFSEINWDNTNFKNEIYVYTSSEDFGNNYKLFIEDIIYALMIRGSKLIPSYQFLKAHNNKVFMELLRKSFSTPIFNNIKTNCYGAYEELYNKLDNQVYPCVIKSYSGAKSTAVRLAKNKEDLKRIAKKLSRSRNYKYEFKDFLRKFIHKGYIPESRHQKKFIVQEFIPDLLNDWKVLVFGKKYYLLKRMVRTNDFRASGSGKFFYDKDYPSGLLDYVSMIFNILNVPNLNVDIAFNGKNFYVLEYQAIHYGTYTISYSDFYFIKESNEWKLIYEKSTLEEEFVNSITEYIQSKL